ncbi:hypothetical protein [Xylanimonas ulmi]|uniref:Ig-like domain-containing protein n=1 Tax=Xylanimonas ulmi TaxID=228973 RepID=A0A4Q7M249_9MICO|nr:hypothetical protein [Xylanibacterium ulmi]RZS61033.1 hypothetical protein EV386_1314 [Xylanibacterium ulmi]
MRPAGRLAAPLTATALALGALIAVAPAAQAAPQVSVTGADGQAQASADGPTTLQVSGHGFQSVPHGYGGIYVLFGWVSDPSGGSWRPSRGGSTGSDYRYVPDTQEADNAGHFRFVAFPGSDTEAQANGGTIAADGTWSTTLAVPGPRFATTDRDGAPVDVDCTQVQCGVITIGAHGVVNAANETFTPVAFGPGASTTPSGVGPGAEPAPEGPSPSPAAIVPGGAGQGLTDPAPTAPGPATLGVDRTTAVAGHVLAFTVQGMTPGEQVVATLDDGAVAVGPLTAGGHGEVAGLMELPSTLRVGAHLLTVVGASSGQRPQAELTVRRDPADATAAEAQAAAAAPAGSGLPGGYTPAETAVAVAALVLLAVVAASAATAIRRARAARRHRRSPAAPPAQAEAAPSTQALEARA